MLENRKSLNKNEIYSSSMKNYMRRGFMFGFGYAMIDDYGNNKLGLILVL